MNWADFFVLMDKFFTKHYDLPPFPIEVYREDTTAIQISFDNLSQLERYIENHATNSINWAYLQYKMYQSKRLLIPPTLQLFLQSNSLSFDKFIESIRRRQFNLADPTNFPLVLRSDSGNFYLIRTRADVNAYFNLRQNTTRDKKDEARYLNVLLAQRDSLTEKEQAQLDSLGVDMDSLIAQMTAGNFKLANSNLFPIVIKTANSAYEIPNSQKLISFFAHRKQQLAEDPKSIEQCKGFFEALSEEGKQLLASIEEPIRHNQLSEADWDFLTMLKDLQFFAPHKEAYDRLELLRNTLLEKSKTPLMNLMAQVSKQNLTKEDREIIFSAIQYSTEAITPEHLFKALDRGDSNLAMSVAEVLINKIKDKTNFKVDSFEKLGDIFLSRPKNAMMLFNFLIVQGIALKSLDDTWGKNFLHYMAENYDPELYIPEDISKFLIQISKTQHSSLFFDKYRDKYRDGQSFIELAKKGNMWKSEAIQTALSEIAKLETKPEADVGNLDVTSLDSRSEDRTQKKPLT